MINSSAHCEGKLVLGGVTELPNVINGFEVIFIQLQLETWSVKSRMTDRDVAN